jgi:hypothetical protein
MPIVAGAASPCVAWLPCAFAVAGLAVALPLAFAFVFLPIGCRFLVLAAGAAIATALANGCTVPAPRLPIAYRSKD